MIKCVIPVLLLILIPALGVGADLYKWYDENGLIHFSNAPPPPLENPSDTLMSVRSLKCQFPEGTSGDWKDGTFKIEKSKFSSPFHFDSIDIKNGKARLIGNVGASDLTVIVTEIALTFIETTGFGNMNFTTVFPTYAKGTKNFIAVHSRHIDILGVPLPSQYHGTCQI